MNLLRDINISSIMWFLVSIGSVYAQYSNVCLTGQANQYETAIAISPLDSNRLLACWSHQSVLDDTSWHSRIGYALSTNGGKTWSNVAVPSYPNNIYKGGDDPGVAIDRYGNAYLAYMARDMDN
jgi:hypothetical protein